jgi:hypothetical protein
MKLGANNPKKTMGAVALFVVALLLFLRTFIGGGGAPSSGTAKAASPSAIPVVPEGRSEPPATTPTQRRTTRRDSRDKGKANPSFTASLDPRLRLDLLSVAEQTQYSGSGRNIFRPEADPIPKPVAPAMKPPVAKVQPAGPPPPPPPPPINLKFFGFATRKGEPKRVFLVNGDDVFIAQEGDIVNRRYKIIRIGPNSVEVEDLLNNHRQNLPLTS